MTLWWMQPGWEQTRCATCGSMIWPEGDPDWGECYSCFSRTLEARQREQSPRCDICGPGEAVTDIAGRAVCSEACARQAEREAAE